MDVALRYVVDGDELSADCHGDGARGVHVRPDRVLPAVPGRRRTSAGRRPSWRAGVATDLRVPGGDRHPRPASTARRRGSTGRSTGWRPRCASGAAVRYRFEGEQFEFEDQRNWTDASYKAYSSATARRAAGVHRGRCGASPSGCGSLVAPPDEPVAARGDDRTVHRRRADRRRAPDRPVRRPALAALLPAGRRLPRAERERGRARRVRLDRARRQRGGARRRRRLGAGDHGPARRHRGADPRGPSRSAGPARAGLVPRRRRRLARRGRRLPAGAAGGAAARAAARPARRDLGRGERRAGGARRAGPAVVPRRGVAGRRAGGPGRGAAGRGAGPRRARGAPRPPRWPRWRPWPAAR